MDILSEPGGMDYHADRYDTWEDGTPPECDICGSEEDVEFQEDDRALCEMCVAEIRTGAMYE